MASTSTHENQNTSSVPAPATSQDPPARKRKTFRDRWASLTHHKSSNPDNGAGNTDTPLHQQAYQPKHAGRDALLAIPLAERKQGDGVKVKAVKSHSLEEMQLAVHPNKSLSSSSLTSWGRDKDGRPVSWGLWSSPGGSMERIPEDGVAVSPGADGRGDGATFLTSQRGSFVTALEKPAPARMSKRFSTSDLNGMGEASGTVTPTDPSGSGSNSNSNTNTSSSLSSTELHLRTRRQSQQATSALIMRQLQDRVSPPPSAKGVVRRPTAIRTTTHPSPLGAEVRKGRKEYFGHGAVGRPSFNGMMAQTTAENAGSAGEAIPQDQQHHGVTWKGKGKAKARFEEHVDQETLDTDKEGSAILAPAAPNFGWPRPSIPAPAIAAETPVSDNNSNSAVTAPGPIRPLRQEDSQDITQDINSSRDRSPSPLRLSSSVERTESGETVNSPTDTAFTSDVSRNESNASSATTADCVDAAEGEGAKKKVKWVGAAEEGEGGAEDGEKEEEEDWGRRVMAAAEAL